jgi:ankyrin repeat protein
MRFHLLLFIVTCVFLRCTAMDKDHPPSDDESIETIFDLIEHRKFDDLVLFIKKYPESLKVAQKGYYALHVAAQKGYSEVVDLLIESGVDYDQRSFWGERALTFAARKGDLGLVTDLVNRGSDPYNRDIFGRAPIAYAVIEGHLQVVSYFLSQSLVPKKFFENQYLWWSGRERLTNNLLTLACCNGHIKIAKALFAAGAPVAIDDPYDTRPLPIAVKEGDGEVVKFLLEHNASVNECNKFLDCLGDDNDGPTPLRSAIEGGYENIVELLLKYGADKEMIYCGKNAQKRAEELYKIQPEKYEKILALLNRHKFRLIMEKSCISDRVEHECVKSSSD